MLKAQLGRLGRSGGPVKAGRWRAGSILARSILSGFSEWDPGVTRRWTEDQAVSGSTAESAGLLAIRQLPKRSNDHVRRSGRSKSLKVNWQVWLIRRGDREGRAAARADRQL